MKIYYAHCMAIYKTKQEARDIIALETLGFSVVNPGSDEVEAVMKTILTSDERMAWFEKFADECDAVFFRALPDGRIPSGVAKEIGWFQVRHKPVFELPSGMIGRTISHEQTREFLTEIGQR